MASFIVDESILRRLTPETRRELLQTLATDLREMRSELAEGDWDAEGNQSFPMTVDEARALVRSCAERTRRMLRVFARNFDGAQGTGELSTLFEAGGYESYDELGQDVSSIHQLLRSVTGHPDAWLFNWRAKDWNWDENQATYSSGIYFISGPAVAALREAFGVTTEPNSKG